MKLINENNVNLNENKFCPINRGLDHEEIEIIQPQIIVPLGYYATRSLLIKYHADPSTEEMSFKNINGKLLVLDGLKIFPLTHPSALLYNPSFEAGTIEKYRKLKAYL